MIDDFINHLRSSANVANLVAERVYNATAPDEGAEFDYVTVQEISSSPEYALSGEVGHALTTVQVDCWSKGSKAGKRAKRIGEAVRNRCSGHTGTVGETRFWPITLSRPGMIIEDPEDGSGDYIKRWSMDFEVFHTQSVPDFT